MENNYENAPQEETQSTQPLLRTRKVQIQSIQTRTKT